MTELVSKVVACRNAGFARFCWARDCNFELVVLALDERLGIADDTKTSPLL